MKTTKKETTKKTARKTGDEFEVGRVPLRDLVGAEKRTKEDLVEILGRVAAFEIRRLFLRGARRLRKVHGKTGSIAYSVLEGNKEVLADEISAIAKVFEGDSVFVQLRREGKVLGTRIVKVREGGAK